jgi:hypothetical protein
MQHSLMKCGNPKYKLENKTVYDSDKIANVVKEGSYNSDI